MATYDDMKAALQSYANGLSIGDPFPSGMVTWGSGADITWDGDDYEVGAAWASGSSFDTLIHGVADWADSVGAGDVTKAKVNEIIASHNQLLSDYDNGVVPTTAVPVVPIP